jgi:hypothetical protein
MAMDGRPFSSPDGQLGTAGITRGFGKISVILAVKIPRPSGRARPCIRRGREAPGRQMWTIRVVPVPLLATAILIGRFGSTHAAFQSSPVQAAGLASAAHVTG